MHGQEAAHHAVELGLELFFAGIDHHLGALAEDELLHLQKAPQIALKDLLGVHFVDLALVEENHLIDGFALAHGWEPGLKGELEGANHSTATGQAMPAACQT
ncbi:hypothetical protein D3C71_1829080 [compost metagenome]